MRKRPAVILMRIGILNEDPFDKTKLAKITRQNITLKIYKDQGLPGRFIWTKGI